MRMMLIFLLSNLILATTCEDMDAGDGRKPQGLRGPQTRCDVKP